jgi:hypothetical protein
MVKLIRLTEVGLPLAHGVSVTGTITWVGNFSLLLKVASLLLVSLIPLTLSMVIISRTGTSSQIYTPPQAYLPGNPLPGFLGDEGCWLGLSYNSSCLIHLQNHDIYWVYEAGTHRILRTTITAEENTIGDLILAWGTPTGFDQDGIWIVMSWDTRSAQLVTTSFNPYSRVRFISYDTELLRLSPWRGFVIINRAQ